MVIAEVLARIRSPEEDAKGAGAVWLSRTDGDPAELGARAVVTRVGSLSNRENQMTGIVPAALVFAVEAAVVIGVIYVMIKWRRPLWLRWLSGTTLYLLYAGIVSRFVPTIWSGMVVAIAAS